MGAFKRRRMKTQKIKLNKRIIGLKSEKLDKGPEKYLLEKLLDIFGNNLTSVVVFGSRARKNYDEYSDLDILVVVGNYKKANEIKQPAIDFSKIYALSLDIHAVSEQDVSDNFRDFSPMYSTFILGVRILFDREMFFRNAFYNFTKKIKKQSIKYCEGGKIWELNKIVRDLEILQIGGYKRC